MINKSIVIFDWDGTLCDSIPRIVASMQQAIQIEGFEARDYTSISNIVGLGLGEAIGTLFPDLDKESREKLRASYSACYREIDSTPAPLFPGALETLERLVSSGCLLAVATGKSRAGLQRVLDGLDMLHFFRASRCADETESKPSPAMVLEILAETGMAAESALVVGDSEYDMEMAAAAGVSRIGVSYGVHQPQRLLRSEPIAVLDTLPDLFAVEGLGSQN